MGELAQMVACRALKSETLGSLPSGGRGNILLLNFFSSLVIL